jgi:IS1 family transposase
MNTIKVLEFLRGRHDGLASITEIRGHVELPNDALFDALYLLGQTGRVKKVGSRLYQYVSDLPKQRSRFQETAEFWDLYQRFREYLKDRQVLSKKEAQNVMGIKGTRLRSLLCVLKRQGEVTIEGELIRYAVTG